MAKVSIIIPTYNVEMYLVECMESVVNQTLKDIEIICINDGSTDGSLEILKSYAQKDDRIVLVDKENGGYVIGMNIGLDKATGEYRKYKAKTLSEVEQDYLDSIKILEQKIEKK